MRPKKKIVTWQDLTFGGKEKKWEKLEKFGK
jgi:hypothetical protein